ncbi:MAG: hypothetical protein KKA32_03035 [Actinobacteria bacterium]|nr:hypothetical protein [Actinomycetota bacterium]
MRAGEEISRTIDIVAALSLEHHVVISCIFVALDRYQAQGSPLLRNVRKEGLAV